MNIGDSTSFRFSDGELLGDSKNFKPLKTNKKASFKLPTEKLLRFDLDLADDEQGNRD